jgi:hypothetical protein
MRTWDDLSDNEKILVKRCVEAMLRMGVTQIVFEKVDKTIRVADATLQQRAITEAIGDIGFKKEMEPTKPRAESIEACRFFEVGKDQWRSFSMKNLISIGGNKVEDLIRI